MNTLELTSHNVRKARTRKMIRLGGLVAKIKLDDWKQRHKYCVDLTISD